MFEFIDFTTTVDGSPYVEGTYAPHLSIRGIHSKRKTISVAPRLNERIELLVPNEFTLADAKRFVAENGRDIYNKLQEWLDAQNPNKPTPPAYDNKIPYLGADVPIRVLPYGDNSGSGFRDGAVYLPAKLSGEEIRAAVLWLLGDMAYDVFKGKLDHFANMLDMRYSRLEIDDGRRTFGSYNQETGVVILSRRLLMMSGAVIDFLIVHELAHAEYFEHGS